MLKKQSLVLVTCLLIVLPISLFLGSIPPSPLYYLKISRETIQSFFIFGDEDQANWLLTKAEKRLTEAEKLKYKNMDIFIKAQIESAREYQYEADKLIIGLKDKTNITYLIDKYVQNKDRLDQFKNY